MRNNEIKSRLKSELEDATPDVFDKIKSSIDEGTAATIITFPQKRKTNFKAVSSLAAMLALIIIGSMFFLNSTPKDTFEIEFDVNPGVVLVVDKNEKVSDVELLNEEAEVVLDSMDLKGTDLNVAVNALMYSIIKHGYIDEMTNSVLVTLSDSNRMVTKDLEKRITENVNSALKESSIEGSILVHSMDSSENLASLAEKYSITIGKAGLIEHLIESGKTIYTFDQLSKLSINEINILMNEYDAFADINVTGSASTKAYIGEETAKKLAYAAFDATEKDVKPIDCMLELDSGVMVYEVEFILAGALYECEVDALTGKVTECDIELAKDKDGAFEIPTTEQSNTVSFLASEDVMDSILSALGLTAADCRNLDIHLDYENGIAKYDISFTAKNTQYDYEVNAIDGGIIESSFKSIEATTLPTTTVPVTEPATTKASATTSATIPTEAQVTTAPVTEKKNEFIGNEKAKEIAFSHLGVNETDVTGLEVEFDYHGTLVYCIEFTYQFAEYEYEINAKTGEIVEFEKDD